MTDPRNVAHDKKVQQEKKHRHDETAATEHAVQPGKKPHMAPVIEAVVTEVEAATDSEPGQG
jgi:hypothetical protein